MSAWGVGSFDNDSAADFIAEVVQDGDFALREAFEVVLDPELDYLEAEEAHRALAAAEILNAVQSGDTRRITDAGLRAWIGSADQTSLLPLRDLALEALDRILGPDSELPDLWADRDDAQAWQADVQRLRQSLS